MESYTNMRRDKYFEHIRNFQLAKARSGYRILKPLIVLLLSEAYP